MIEHFDVVKSFDSFTKTVLKRYGRKAIHEPLSSPTTYINKQEFFICTKTINEERSSINSLSLSQCFERCSILPDIEHDSALALQYVIVVPTQNLTASDHPIPTRQKKIKTTEASNVTDTCFKINGN